MSTPRALGHWAITAVLLAALGAGCERHATATSANASLGSETQTRSVLAFVLEGERLRAFTRRELEALATAERVTGFDPYYGRVKSFRAVPLAPVLEAVFAGRGRALPREQFVLRARDGFTVPLTGERLLEPGAYIAVEDLEVPGWEPIGPQRANPAPFYLIWRGAHQQSLDTYPRPWQLAEVELTHFERVFPHTVPAGVEEGSAASRGFALFRELCVRCHAINREGGRVGPDLNVPQSIVEYRPEAQIRAYIRNPLAFRYGNMPPHPSLTDADLDALLAYFHAMRVRKHDPEATGP